MNSEYKIKLILLFHHIMVLYGLIYASPYWLFLSIVGWILIVRIGGEVGLHRYFTHRSFTTSKFKDWILTVLAILNCAGSPLMWVGVHRKHHAKTDTDHDPHGNQPIWRVWSTFWRPYTIEMKYVADLVKNPTQRFIHQHYFKIIIFTYIALFLIKWEIAVFFISTSSVIAIHSAGMVNSLCHRFGYRNFETNDKSTNNTLVNWLTLGSGLHNNHHADPMNYSNKKLKNEIDFPGWIIDKFFIAKTTI